MPSSRLDEQASSKMPQREDRVVTTLLHECE